MLLITGATGYIGRHLVARLVSQGERPRCLVRDIDKAKTILPADKVELVKGDTTQTAALNAAMQGIDTVVHAAFITADRKSPGGNFYNETNVNGTIHVVEAAKLAKVQRIILLSGLGTRPDKPGSYMQGRYEAEQAVMKSGISYSIIRPSVLFGKGASFVVGLANLAKTSPVLPLIGGGKMMFQPIYVEDVVTVITKILENPQTTSNKIFTIGGPGYYSFTQVFDEITKAMHIHRLKVYAPTPLVGLGAAVMEMVFPKPPLTKAAMALFAFDNTTDLNSVERDFGFTPTSFSTYLAENGV